MSWFSWTGDSSGGGGGGGTWGSITGTLSNQTDLSTALGLKADDSAVVKLTGSQTVAGNKTFSSNVLFGSSVNLGRDTGVSGSLTDCVTTLFTNAIHCKTILNWSANSASTGLNTTVDSGTSITFKSGSTGLLGIQSTQLNFFKRFHLGTGENTIVDFMSSTLSSTSATPVTGYTFSTAGRNDWDFNLEVHFMGRRSDSPGEHIHVSKAIYFKRVAGTNTHIMTTTIYVARSTFTTADIQYYISGDNIGFEFVGEAGKTIKGFWWVTNTMGST